MSRRSRHCSAVAKSPCSLLFRNVSIVCRGVDTFRAARPVRPVRRTAHTMINRFVTAQARKGLLAVIGTLLRGAGALGQLALPRIERPLLARVRFANRTRVHTLE